MESEVIRGVAQSDPVYPRDSSLLFENGTLVKATGHSIDLFLDLAYVLNFKPVMKKGAGWGDKLPNGSWSGMSTQLLANETDIVISHATFTAERAEVFTYFQPTYLGSYLAHFRPLPSRSIRNVFVQPFHKEVWLVLLVASVVALLSLKIMYAFKFKSVFDGFPYLRDFTMGKHYERGSLSDLLLWIIGCISQKGWSLTPEGLGMKLVFLTTIANTTILYVAYSANLVAIFKTGENPITDFTTLKKQLKIIGDKSIPFIADIMQNTRQKNNKRSQHQEFMARNDAVEKVLTTRSAFLTVDGFFTAFVDSNRTTYEYCQQISTIKALKTTRWAGMYARRNWSKKEVFGRSIIKVIERGLNYRYSLNADRLLSPFCSLNRGWASNEEIQMADVATAFVMFALSLCISLLVLALETVFNFRLFLYACRSKHVREVSKS